MNPIETGALLLREAVSRPRWALYHLFGYLDERYLLSYYRKRLDQSRRYLASVEDVLAGARRSAGSAPEGPGEGAVLPPVSSETSSFKISPRSDGSTELVNLVWWMTRILRPETVVEVGVGRGATTRAILAAMRANGRGHLYSVEFPALRRGYAEEVGVLVTPDLRDRWTLVIGPSQVSIRALRAKVPGVDLFVHDGAHSYHVQRGDYEQAICSLRPGGVLISDDVNNDSFVEVMERHGLAPMLVHQGKEFPMGVAFKTRRA